MNIADIVPEDKKSEALNLVERVLSGHEVNRMETERIAKDGSTLTVVLTATVVRDDKHEMSYVATTERDVTEGQHAP